MAENDYNEAINIDSDKIKLMAKRKFKSACLKVSAVLGISMAAAAILLSRPLMAYMSREFCYSMQSPPSYWPNPISGLWSSTWSLYQCEWAGNFGFHWYDVFAWLTTSWQSIIASVGSCTGIYALLRTFQQPKPGENQAAPLSYPVEDARFLSLLREMKKEGYFPSGGPQYIEAPEEGIDLEAATTPGQRFNV